MSEQAMDYAGLIQSCQIDADIVEGGGDIAPSLGDDAAATLRAAASAISALMTERERLKPYMLAAADSLDAARIARAGGAVCESHVLRVMQAEAERLRHHAALTPPVAAT